MKIHPTINCCCTVPSQMSTIFFLFFFSSIKGFLIFSYLIYFYKVLLWNDNEVHGEWQIDFCFCFFLERGQIKPRPGKHFWLFIDNIIRSFSQITIIRILIMGSMFGVCIFFSCCVLTVPPNFLPHSQNIHVSLLEDTPFFFGVNASMTACFSICICALWQGGDKSRMYPVFFFSCPQTAGTCSSSPTNLMMTCTLKNARRDGN